MGLENSRRESNSGTGRADFNKEGGAMLPIVMKKQGLEFVEVGCHENSVVVRMVSETSTEKPPSRKRHTLGALMGWGLSTTARIRHKFARLKSNSSSLIEQPSLMSTRDVRRFKAKFQRTRSGAGKALEGLRFISKTTGSPSSRQALWRNVERRFESLSEDGLLARDDFGQCIDMNSKEFAVSIFDALARRKRRMILRITKHELYDFWQQISDQSFDARLQIFFDMADSNADGRITREEVQELITLSASANNLSQLKEQAHEYASLIMEELDPENFGYIELWQLETLLLQGDAYMNYSRTLSRSSAGWSPKITSSKPSEGVVSRMRGFLLNNWQRGWIILLWIVAMGFVFFWKFVEYKNKTAFRVMGYCLPTAKGAAETLKLNMALVLLPVCRNTLTWLRSTSARHFVPFDDNINFHKMIASAIGVGIILHAGNHLGCDFPRLINSSPQQFSYVASQFHNKRPTLRTLVMSVEGITGILMVILMAISFTLASHHFRKSILKLPPPFDRFTGFNAFWYSHHLLGFVYVLMLIHGSFLLLVHKMSQKTTWAYILVPFSLYLAEKAIRTCRSGYFTVNTLKVSVLPGDVLTLTFSKPNGFSYKSGQYIFLQCPKISHFEWHPFSITSAPSDDCLSVHIRTAGDWTGELRRIFAENQMGLPKSATESLPRLLVDGPYGGSAQDYQNYDVLLLVGLGIGATPFVSILRDILNSTKSAEEQESRTETSGSEDKVNNSIGKKKAKRITRRAYFYWVTRETASFEWFKGVMNEVADIDPKAQIELHNYLTSVYEEGDARSTLLTMVQALKHAKDGVDILSGTRVRTHFARPKWREVFTALAVKHPHETVGVFYCGVPALAKELKLLSLEQTNTTATRFDFHKEYF